MADLVEEIPSDKKKKESKFPHGQPRKPEMVREIQRLREVEKMQWREIGPLVGMSGQGACMMYIHWKTMGWLKPIEIEPGTND